MQPSTAPKLPAGPFAASVNTNHYPYCPLCGVPLTRETWTTFAGVAFCMTCAHPRWLAAMRTFAGAVNKYRYLAASTCRSHGITFWTPREEHQRGKTAYELHPEWVPVICTE